MRVIVWGMLITKAMKHAEQEKKINTPIRIPLAIDFMRMLFGVGKPNDRSPRNEGQRLDV